MSKEIVVIGPSKVGKTALVASLQQSANVLSLAFRDENINVRITPKNQQTRELFNKVLSLLAHGYLPFQGTQDLIEYEIHLSSPRIKPDLIDQLYRLLGWGEAENCQIHFPDAPGGALFAGDDESSLRKW